MENYNCNNVALKHLNSSSSTDNGQERRGGFVRHGADAGGEAEDGDQEDEDDQGTAGALQVDSGS